MKELRELIERTGSKALIEVDGGVNLETGARLIAAGQMHWWQEMLSLLLRIRKE